MSGNCRWRRPPATDRCRRGSARTPPPPPRRPAARATRASGRCAGSAPPHRARVDVAGDLGRRRLAAQLAAQLALRAHDLVQLLDDVHRHANRPRLVGERTRDGLSDPPRRVGRELEALAMVELLGRTAEPDRTFLDEIEERQPLVAVPLGDRDYEAEVRLDHLLLRGMVAALDPLCELDLLRCGQQIDLADIAQERLQAIGHRWRNACRQ